METMTSSSLPLPREASTYDEVSMQQSLLFSDSLKDLKNLRSQLYSAAEYFELSYTNDDQKQIVMETLKEYAIKALVNTVDHLGSVTYKRLRTCHEYMDHEGVSQQSLVIDTPKYHKRYILPVGESMNGGRTKSKYQGRSLDDEDDWHQFRNAVRATIRDTPSSSFRKGNSPSPSPRLSRPATFSFTGTMPRKDLEKRAVSPHRFPLLRSGSVSSRPTTPNSSRPTTPNTAAARRYPSEPRKSASMRLHPERENSKDMEQYPSKSKRLLKALLSRRKSKKDEMLYTYLDEY
ncbi:hypothetical protein PVL29_021794 [Vitis rotundifolia]|uniref:Protein ABIL2 n=1 Tax=Vitis rotundifolia TaxID=103349 RepID=A0AA38Z0J8_VITRO|nr:hypothetical protein PVL29_021794 [Vitis rotundifolia]